MEHHTALTTAAPITQCLCLIHGEGLPDVLGFWRTSDRMTACMIVTGSDASFLVYVDDFLAEGPRGILRSPSQLIVTMCGRAATRISWEENLEM